MVCILYFHVHARKHNVYLDTNYVFYIAPVFLFHIWIKNMQAKTTIFNSLAYEAYLLRHLDHNVAQLCQRLPISLNEEPLLQPRLLWLAPIAWQILMAAHV